MMTPILHYALSTAEPSQFILTKKIKIKNKKNKEKE
jgi:hypothetical protein